jgi:ParB-like chromosome segregation protein Spo0J
MTTIDATTPAANPAPSVPSKRPRPAPTIGTNDEAARALPGARSSLVVPGKDLPPCVRDQLLDPATCDVMPGHQHPADDIDELGDSIAIVGQLHAGQVFEVPDGRRFVAAGRRRWLACKKRGFLYRADVWQCPDESSVRSQDLASIIRLVENEQRRDPSAYDLSVQLRQIRNENGFQTAAAIAAHVGLTEARVKKYLAIFQGSDRLLEAAQKHQLAIGLLTELVRAEKQYGEAKTRRFLAKAIAGELTTADLNRQRNVSRHGVRGTRTRRIDSDWASIERRIRRLCDADPEGASAHLESLLASLRATLEQPKVAG